jgi:hypothetical protein
MDIQDEQDKNLCSSHFHLFAGTPRARVVSSGKLAATAQEIDSGE